MPGSFCRDGHAGGDARGPVRREQREFTRRAQRLPDRRCLAGSGDGGFTRHEAVLESHRPEERWAPTEELPKRMGCSQTLP